MIRVVKKRGERPEISKNLGKQTSTTNQTIPIFITRLNNPKVKTLKGKVMKFKIGFIKKLIKPRIKPAIKRI